MTIAPDRTRRTSPVDAPTGRARAWRYTALMTALGVALAVAMTAGVSIGSVRLPVGEVWSVIAHHLGLKGDGPDGATDTIVWVVRVPRVLLAVVVGAGLAVVGVALQAVVRNPIADPYILGMSSGASVGAVAVIAFGAGAALGVWALSAAAFAGAIVAALVVIVVASRRALTPLRIILAGTAVTYAASAIASFMIYRSRHLEHAATVLFWLMGSLSGATWHKLVPVSIVVTLGTIALWANGRHLNALLAGDDTAAALGVDVRRLRLRLVIITVLMTATIVAVSGAIGFVGLLLPHIGRYLVGVDHRKLIPVCVLLGSTYLVLVDLVARTVASPEEIPVGIITAGVGAPFFLWALNRSGRQAGELT